MPTDFLANAKPVKPQEDFLANATPVTTPPPTPPNEGFFHSLGSSLGITPESSQAGLDEFKAHPIETGLKNLVGGPALPVLEGAYQGVKRIGGELIDAGKDAFSGNGAGALRHGIRAIPLIGPGEDKAAEQSANGDTAGAAGTIFGTALQAAPAILGGVDAVAPNRGLIAPIPSTARAVAKFNSLKSDLANLPITPTNSAGPLNDMLTLGRQGGGAVPVPARQLAARIGEGAPRSVPILRQMQNDLNGTSDAQAVPSPVLYPEARNFQHGLSTLSREDSDALGGPMKGGLKQLNKGIYKDIYDATSSVGRGEDYADAMREFRQAAQLKDVAKKVGAGLGGAVVASTVGPPVYRFLKSLVP